MCIHCHAVVAPPPQVLNPMSAVAIPGQQSGSHYAVLAPSLPSLHGMLQKYL